MSQKILLVKIILINFFQCVLYIFDDGKITATCEKKDGTDFAAEQTNAEVCERKRTRDWSNEDIHSV